MKAHQYAPPAEVGGEAYPYQRTSGGSGVYLRHVWGDICYGLVPNASENSTVYATAWVHSDAAMTAGLIFETQNYSRSEADVAPQQGTWDYKGSRLWVNGEAIVPPAGRMLSGSATLIFPLPTRTQLRAHPYRSSCRRAGIKF